MKFIKIILTVGLLVFMSNLSVAQNPSADQKLWEGLDERNPKLVKEALDEGANIESRRGRLTPLLWAIQNRELSLISLLMLEGADTNARLHDNKTGLTIAIQGKQGKIVALLTAGGAKDFGLFSFGWFSWDGIVKYYEHPNFGHENIIQFLIANGIDVDTRDTNGWTPLMYGAAYGRTEDIQFLLDRGADTEAKTTDGEKTAIKLAEDSNHNDIARRIRATTCQRAFNTPRGRSVLNSLL